MNKTVEEAIFLASRLKKLLKSKDNMEIVLCPPFTALDSVARELNNSNIRLGAQNMYFENVGAFTGEVSPLMLKEIGCEYVILGHSERREIFGEDDALINKKVISALNHLLKPILCVGENLEQKNNSKTKETIGVQLKNCLKNVNEGQISNVIIAYEPIWAISKGNPNHKSATAEDAEGAHKFIRNTLLKIYNENTAKNARIIYGGSMKSENAKELLSMPDIDGGLVGNASLDAESFARIINWV